MDKLLFGTAGIPISCYGCNTERGIAGVRELNLDAMELEFVHSVNISKEKAPLVKKSAEKNNIVLTCHAQYYINLSSKEDAKISASKQRILNAARIANMCVAWSVVFHAGFYHDNSKEKVYDIIEKNLMEVSSTLKDEGNNIWIRPETTGKLAQFGTVDEILRLSQEIENVMPCIDFSHLHARSNGKINSEQDFRQILQKVEDALGKKGLNNMHIHLSGINYGERGEKNHLNLQESQLNYKDLIKAWKEFGVKGVVISESPNIEGDARLIKDVYDGL
ncbi:MAG TPA: TIM barrel protein [Candidatus Nanoarchaeia archaeon]|nr:TIM barrel protein [Candidatus Nanoarchaeia archaeon]